MGMACGPLWDRGAFPPDSQGLSLEGALGPQGLSGEPQGTFSSLVALSEGQASRRQKPPALAGRWQDSQLSLLASGRHNRGPQEDRAEVRVGETCADLTVSIDR